MASRTVSGPSERSVALRRLAAADRIAAIADPGSVAAIDAALSAPRPSPHLARWKILAQDDDGIVVARARIFGAPVLFAAQDERFLGGSAGANHADTLRRLFECARAERPAAVILLAASGGVRLYEANPAEWALARALSALLDARAAGIPVFAIGVGDLFGGSAVLACAADRVAFLPGTKLGLSGPKVIEMAHGRSEVDASDDAAVAALFGAEARAAAGAIELIADDRDIARAWVAACLRGNTTFAERVHALQVRLTERLFTRYVRRDAPDARRTPAQPSLEFVFADAQPVAPGASLWRIDERSIWLTHPFGGRTFGPREAHLLDAELLTHLSGDRSSDGETLVLVEDSAGHEATAAAEAVCVSQYLAQHAAVLALLRARGVRVVGLLTGTGHSAAFFVNALQASRTYALPGARVVAMEPPAIARVTRLDPSRFGALIEDDPVLGHPVRHFAAWSGIAELHSDASREWLSSLEQTNEPPST